tara:strand:+ start:1677 stop:2324 length:648 start_codon:yes stop_codon:yes gene_type:complete
MAAKDQPKDLRAVIHPDIFSRIQDEIPKFERDSGISGVVNRLINEGLDSRVKFKRPPGSYSYSSSSNSLEGLDKSLREGRETFLFNPPLTEQFTCHDPKEHEAFLKEQKKLAQKDSPSFQIFWEVYQASPSKAHNQSKSKARTAWKEALKTEKAENLIEAAKRAVKDQASKIGQEIWCAPFPDAHRWLRDECYSVFLEDHIATQPERIIPGVTVL